MFKSLILLAAFVVTASCAVQEEAADVEKTARQIFSSGLFPFLFPNIKASVGTINLPNGNSVPGLTFKRYRPQNPLGPITAKSAIYTATANPNVTGSIYLTQNSRDGNIFGVGLLRGLANGETFNVHVRTNADITNNCGLQGNVFTPDLDPLQAQLFTGQADATGRASFTIQELPPSLVTFFGKNSVLNRSIRVVTGTDPNTGVIRGCGELEPTPEMTVTYG